jgi:hypothetical protein
MLARLALGTVLAGSVLVIGSLWLGWVLGPVCDPGACPGGFPDGELTAWEAFAFADAALLVAAVIAGALALGAAALGSPAAAYAAALVGWCAAAGALYADDRPAHAAGYLPTAHGIGLFVALCAAGLICVGSLALAAATTVDAP